MKIKEGYNDKELQIRINHESGRVANMWIEFGCQPNKETLSYVTLEELLDLKDEISNAIKEIVEKGGVK